jgi:hypothetical protein
MMRRPSQLILNNHEGWLFKSIYIMQEKPKIHDVRALSEVTYGNLSQ